ncbi:MAG: hypothetical protein V7708_17355 [Oceanicoccus sp.]
MSKKKRELAVPKSKDSNEIAFAKIGLSPTINAASTIELVRGKHYGGLDIGCLVSELKNQVAATKDGNLDRPEALLLSQAHTLDALFNTLCERAVSNMGTYLSTTETYMRLALKAQNQCQATLRTLGEIKAPKNVAFVKQANIANNQQVNNGIVETATDNPARKTKNQQNKLLENDHGKRLDGRAETATSGIDQELETLGAVNRPQK